MSNVPTKPISRRASIWVMVFCAIVFASALHLTTRAQAAWFLPVAFIWGVASFQRGRAPTVFVIMATAATLRLFFVGTPPHLSDDLFRYLFEGLALNSGHNPFIEAPQSLQSLNPILASKVNHPSLTSIYPPLSLLWFRFLSVFGDQAYIVQLCTGAVDLLTVYNLTKVQKSRSASWLWACHPLVVLESTVGAHLETVAISGMVLCLSYIPKAKWEWAFSIGALVKALPIAMVLSLRPKNAWVAPLAAVFGLVVSYPVWMDLNLSSASTYAQHWSFNPFVFELLHDKIGSAARPLLVACAAAVIIWAFYRRCSPLVTWWIVATAFLVTSPTVHPWYVLWALAPAALLGWRGWEVGATATLGSYYVLTTVDSAQGWHEPTFLWWLVWPPTMVALFYDYAERRDCTATIE